MIYIREEYLISYTSAQTNESRQIEKCNKNTLEISL